MRSATGRTVATPAAPAVLGDDAERAKALVVWASERGLALTRVSVNGVSLELAPRATGVTMPGATAKGGRLLDKSDDDARHDLYASVAGEAIAKMVGGGIGTDDDDEPVIGSAAG